VLFNLTLAISSQVLPRKRLEYLIVKTLIVKLTRIKMVKLKNLGLTKTVNLHIGIDFNIWLLFSLMSTYYFPEMFGIIS
jgi:hypothetical protein